MPVTLDPADFVFYEINEALLRACQTGHRAEIWTRHDYEFINIYLDGFELGQGKVAALLKSENPRLVQMIQSRISLFAEIVRETESRFQIQFKESSAEDVWAAVAQARAISDSAEGLQQAAQRGMQALILQKLMAEFKPKSLHLECTIRTPCPVRLDVGDALILKENTAQYYAETQCRYIILHSPTTQKTGYIKAGADIRNRILKAHFNGYAVTARVVGVVDEIQSHALASIWEECEALIEVNLSKNPVG
jgi:hypothetical protein